MNQIFSWKNTSIYLLSWGCILGYALIENWIRYVCFGVVIIILAWKFPIFINNTQDEVKKDEC